MIASGLAFACRAPSALPGVSDPAGGFLVRWRISMYGNVDLDGRHRKSEIDAQQIGYTEAAERNHLSLTNPAGDTFNY